MHDVKMLYILTQRGLYNRKCHSFSLCKCKHGAGAAKDSQRYQILTHAEHVKFNNKSKEQEQKMKLAQVEGYLSFV